MPQARHSTPSQQTKDCVRNLRSKLGQDKAQFAARALQRVHLECLAGRWMRIKKR